MQAFLNLISALLRCALAFFRSRNEQAIVELALRQQLTTFAQTGSKPKLTPVDRAFWVALFRFWPGWRDTLVIVKPDTVIRWHRKGEEAKLPSGLYWRYLKAWPRAAADFCGAEGAHSSARNREQLACAKDPRRAQEARFQRQPPNCLALSPEESAQSWYTAAMDDVSSLS